MGKHVVQADVCLHRKLYKFFPSFIFIKSSQRSSINIEFTNTNYRIPLRAGDDFNWAEWVIEQQEIYIAKKVIYGPVVAWADFQQSAAGNHERLGPPPQEGACTNGSYFSSNWFNLDQLEDAGYLDKSSKLKWYSRRGRLKQDYDHGDVASSWYCQDDSTVVVLSWYASCFIIEKEDNGGTALPSNIRCTFLHSDHANISTILL